MNCYKKKKTNLFRNLHCKHFCASFSLLALSELFVLHKKGKNSWLNQKKKKKRKQGDNFFLRNPRTGNICSADEIEALFLWQLLYYLWPNLRSISVLSANKTSAIRYVIGKRVSLLLYKSIINSKVIKIRRTCGIRIT